MWKPTTITLTGVVSMHTLRMCSNDGTADVITSNRSGVRSKRGDILIRIVRCEPTSNHFVARGKPNFQPLPPWTVFPPKRPPGSLFAPSRLSMRKSNKNWQPFVRPARRLRPSTNWGKGFYRWFAPAEASTSPPG